MDRNFFRRIELCFPVLDPALKRRVIREGLQPYLDDNCQAWVMNGRRRLREAQAAPRPAPLGAGRAAIHARHTDVMCDSAMSAVRQKRVLTKARPVCGGIINAIALVAVRALPPRRGTKTPFAWS